MDNSPRTLTLATLLASLATPGLAQDGSLVLEEVIVTAQKRTESLEETPMTINVVTGEQIVETASFSFGDIGNLTAGLTIRGSGFETDIGTRGLGTEINAAVSPRVTIYLDGAFISQQRGLFSSLFDVSQVELLRGPQGTLYGQASPAGALTIQSRNPNIEEIDGYVEQSFNEHDGSNTQGGISLPIIKNQLSLRLSGVYDTNENSQVTNITRDQDLENETTAYRIVGLWEPTDRFNLRLAYHDFDDKFDIDPVVKGDGIEFDDRVAVADYKSTMKNEMQITILEMNYEFADNLTATVVASEQDNEVTRNWDADGSAVRGQNQRVISKVPDLYNVEARLASQGNETWDWTVGAYYQDSESNTPVFVDTYVASTPRSTLLAKTTGPALIDRNSLGLFTHNSINVTANGTLTVGLRYIDDEAKNHQTFNTSLYFLQPDGSIPDTPFAELPPQEGVLPENQEDSDHAFTGTLKYQHQFTDDLMGYAAYDRGWRAGAPNIAGAPQPPVFGAVDAEDSDNFELGYKWSFLEGRALWNLAVYYQLYNDFQYQADSVEFRTADGGIDLADPTVNVNEAEVYGLDTDITMLLSEQWSLSAALSYTKTELTDAESVPCTNGQPVGNEEWDFNTCNLNGERAGSLPEWSGNLSTEYFQPIGAGGTEWYVRALANADSEYYSPSEQMDLDSYATLDLFLGWRTTSRNWDVRLWVKNVTDEDAELSTVRLPLIPDYANGGETDSGLTWVRRQLDSRTVGLTVGYSF